MRWGKAALLWWFAVAGQACGGREARELSTAAREARARDALGRGDVPAAIQELESALEQGPSLPVWLTLAQLHAASGAYDEARTYLEAAERHDPWQAPVKIGLGDVAAGQGDLSAAAGYYREARELAPGSLDGNLRWAALVSSPDGCVEGDEVLAAVPDPQRTAELALVQAELAKCLGQPERWVALRLEAEQSKVAHPARAAMLGRLYLERDPPHLRAAERLLALATTPEYASAALRVLHASTCADLGDFARAERALEAAERAELQRPVGALDSPEVGLLRARIDVERGRAERAAAGLPDLLPTLAPSRRPLARAILGRALLRSGNPIAGKAELAKLSPRDPGYATAQLALSEQQVMEGDRGGAIDTLSRLKDVRPGHGRVYGRLSALLREAGQDEEALSVLSAGVVSAPAEPGLWHELGRLLVARDPVRAAGHLEQALRLDPQYLPALALLAELRVQAGQPEQATVLYEQALSRDPNNVLLKNNLAALYAAQGQRLERALALAYEANLAAPESAAIEDTLGYVLLRRGRPDLALPHLEAALAAAPGDPESRLHHGLALQALGRTAEAEEAFSAAAQSAGEGFAGDRIRRTLAEARTVLP